MSVTELVVELQKTHTGDEKIDHLLEQAALKLASLHEEIRLGHWHHAEKVAGITLRNVAERVEQQ